MRAIYYDTETTGINSQSDKIVEIAAYDPERDRQFVELVNPECPIPDTASAIHHIDDQMVADKPNFGVVGQQFIDFCEGDVVLIAHNNDGFDIHFLRAEFGRHDMAIPDHWQFVDTLKWARRYRPDLPRHALQFLREIYGVEANNAHRAMDDVTVLYEVFSKMVGDLPLEKIVELMAKKTKMTRMPFGKHRGVPLEKVPGSYVRWLDEQGALDKPENKQLRSSFEALGVLNSE